jgi:hypothetical protein
MDFLFPTRVPSWLPNGESGIGKRPFGSKQADNRAAGRLLKLVLTDNAGTYSVRVTGTDTNFLKAFLGGGNVSKVLMVYTEAGTVYGPQYSTVGPAVAEAIAQDVYTLNPIEA